MLDAIWRISLDLAPWLLLGAALSGLLHAALPPDFLRRQLQGKLGVLKAVLFGVPLPLCSCGVIPAGLGLKRDGASSGASLGFLIATPQTGVDSVVVSASMLGWPFALFKVAAALVTGTVGGLAVEAWAPGVVDAPQPAPAGGTGSRSRLREAIDHSTMVVQSIWRWLVFGVVLSAALDVFVPAEVWTRVASWSPGLSILAALAISLPLYVCATASVPIAASLVAGGLPAGAALVFLMAGPATNVATIGAIRKGLGSRATGIYLATVIVGSVGLGLLFDVLVPSALVATGHTHGHAGVVTQALAVAFWLMLGYFAALDLRDALRSGKRGASQLADGHEDGNGHARGAGEGEAVDLDVAVAGLTCQGCARKLERALRADAAIEFAEVSFEPQRARVHGHLKAGQLARLVEQAGYRVVDAVE